MRKDAKLRIFSTISGILTAFVCAAVLAAPQAAATDTDVKIQEQCQTQYPATSSLKAGTAYLLDEHNAYTWRCKQDPIGSAKAVTDLSVDVQAYCTRHKLGNAMARDIYNAYSWKCATTPMPGSGDSWIDCSGTAVCTKYWSRTKTKDINKELGSAKTADNTVQYAAAAICGLAGFMAGGGPVSPATGAALAGVVGTACKQGINTIFPNDLNGLDTATAAAVTANGCLQVAFPKDGGAGPRKWSYTTDHGYCWDK
ncbi:hypothetical protein ACQP0C_41840 (plasmid) [Nocardia sp. CA-129566]|uniref:hypothetical protein n=1 Tax=Nocardia sp. CA-129566 TaxID=3239976 RepID=UPI003D98723E